MHYDGTVKLLIDRRVLTGDEGGIPEKMKLDFDGNLQVNFHLHFTSPEAINASLVQRKRDILAVYSENFKFVKTHLHINDYAMHSDALVAALEELGVDQISLTRLPASLEEGRDDHFLSDTPQKAASVRARLDLADPNSNPVTTEMLEALITPDQKSAFGRVLWNLCALMAYELGPTDVESLC